MEGKIVLKGFIKREVNKVLLGHISMSSHKINLDLTDILETGSSVEPWVGEQGHVESTNTIDTFEDSLNIFIYSEVK